MSVYEGLGVPQTAIHRIREDGGGFTAEVVCGAPVVHATRATLEDEWVTCLACRSRSGVAPAADDPVHGVVADPDQMGGDL